MGMSKLTTAARNALPASAFVFPDKREYPIHDINHARDALSRSSGKPEEAAVRAAVSRRYPGLAQNHDSHKKPPPMKGKQGY